MSTILSNCEDDHDDDKEEEEGKKASRPPAKQQKQPQQQKRQEEFESCSNTSLLPASSRPSTNNNNTPPNTANSEERKNFSCKICFEQYSKHVRPPISLNCGHTFCLACIRQLGQLRSSIQCGVCRRETYSNYRNLGKNVLLMELMEKMHLLENDDGEEHHQKDQPGPAADQTNQFLCRTDLETFYEELSSLETLAREALLEERPVNQLRWEMHEVEALLANAGSSYQRIVTKMEEVRTITTALAMQRILEEQHNPSMSTRARAPAQEWPSYHHLSRSPVTVMRRPLTPDTEDEMRAYRERHPPHTRSRGRPWPHQQGQGTSWGNWQRNGGYNRRRRRGRVPPQQPVIIAPFNYHDEPVMNDDWGSSSGWGTNDEDDNAGQQKQQPANNNNNNASGQPAAGAEQQPQQPVHVEQPVQVQAEQQQKQQQVVADTSWDWDSSSGWGTDNDDEGDGKGEEGNNGRKKKHKKTKQQRQQQKPVDDTNKSLTTWESCSSGDEQIGGEGGQEEGQVY